MGGGGNQSAAAAHVAACHLWEAMGRFCGWQARPAHVPCRMEPPAALKAQSGRHNQELQLPLQFAALSVATPGILCCGNTKLATPLATLGAATHCCPPPAKTNGSTGGTCACPTRRSSQWPVVASGCACNV
mmetsp:Transcript_8520/g.25804  ORF Transcript_8520/g.25804 Transcript_8520/m.25804 type:complete len:131 (-) Transcript_8520:375-767(-)